MTKERLQALKSVTTWAGVLITLSGIALNLASGGNWQGNGLSLLGVAITCCGHWIGKALGKHQATEKAADEKRMAELEDRFEQSHAETESMSEFLNKTGVFDNPDSLRRIIREQDSRYAEEHQDDGH